VSSGPKKHFWSTAPPARVIFPSLVLGLYLALWLVAPEKTTLALRSSMALFYHVLVPLCVVFLLMVGLNLFLKPPYLTRFLGGRPSIRRWMFSAAAGIISAGPIYAWYPMLKDLREKGAKHSLIAVFLVNRAVKPFLLPMMISFFGWAYVVAFVLLIMAGSLCVGLLVGAVLDAPSVSG
jgi:uncharacterized membrane protein YraQ (UPF0718 family)